MNRRAALQIAGATAAGAAVLAQAPRVGWAHDLRPTDPARPALRLPGWSTCCQHGDGRARRAVATMGTGATVRRATLAQRARGVPSTLWFIPAVRQARSPITTSRVMPTPSTTTIRGTSRARRLVAGSCRPPCWPTLYSTSCTSSTTSGSCKHSAHGRSWSSLDRSEGPGRHPSRNANRQVRETRRTVHRCHRSCE